MSRNNFLIGLLIGVLLCSCSGNDNRAGSNVNSGPDYSIIYNVLLNDTTDNYEVFSMNPDGSEKKNITRLPGVEWSYHSFNNKVFFISDKDTCHRCYFLYSSDFEGNRITKISGFQLSDSWMSTRNNGKEIIVKPHSQIDSVFYILNMDGSLLQKLEYGFPFASDPLFVNDGKQVVFRAGQTKSKLIDGFNEELFIINEDGTNCIQLTHYPVNDTTADKFAYKAGPPKLHPTQNFVSYQSKQNGKYSLYAVSLDGTKQWKLTTNSENEGWHDWSPDGKWLAIELFDNDQTQFHIGLMNWETKKMEILTDTTYKYQQSPNFVLKTDKQ